MAKRLFNVLFAQQTGSHSGLDVCVFDAQINFMIVQPR